VLPELETTSQPLGAVGEEQAATAIMAAAATTRAIERRIVIVMASIWNGRVNKLKTKVM
jgi:hypothetical protein